MAIPCGLPHLRPRKGGNRLMADVRIPIRETFEATVRSVGGQIVADIVTDNGKLDENADYVFREDNCIAELKCLENDLTRSPDFVAKVHSLYYSWAEGGLVPPPTAPRFLISTGALPLPCALELTDLLKPTIERLVRKASAQIKK